MIDEPGITMYRQATDGVAAHWEIDDPAMVKVETTVFANRAGARVTVYDPAPVLPLMFPQGDPVAIILPVGSWLIETSSDGVNYEPLATIAALPMPDEGSGTAINLTLDGAPFPVRYSRYTKQPPP